MDEAGKDLSQYGPLTQHEQHKSTRDIRLPVRVVKARALYYIRDAGDLGGSIVTTCDNRWAAHSASLLMGDLEASAASSPSLRFMFDANARSSNLCVTRFTHDACSAVWLCGVVEPAAVSADMWVEIANDLKRAMGQKESASCCEEV